MNRSPVISIISLSSALAVILLDCNLALAATSPAQQTLARPYNLVKRFADIKQDDHKQMMHSHLSRKVFDRACAASKDTIDEIIACMTNNESLVKSVKKEDAANCYKETYGVDFNPTDVNVHKELICKNRDKFEAMTACIYRKTAETLDSKEMEKITEAMVDVGLCIINALDG